MGEGRLGGCKGEGRYAIKGGVIARAMEETDVDKGREEKRFGINFGRDLWKGEGGRGGQPSASFDVGCLI